MEVSADGSFDLDAVEKLACAVCMTDTSAVEVTTASCCHPKHGICLPTRVCVCVRRHVWWFLITWLHVSHYCARVSKTQKRLDQAAERTKVGSGRGCLATALMQPKRRNPIRDGTGSMGCVAQGCAGVSAQRRSTTKRARVMCR